MNLFRNSINANPRSSRLWMDCCYIEASFDWRENYSVRKSRWTTNSELWPTPRLHSIGPCPKHIINCTFQRYLALQLLFFGGNTARLERFGNRHFLLWTALPSPSMSSVVAMFKLSSIIIITQWATRQQSTAWETKTNLCIIQWSEQGRLWFLPAEQIIKS